MKLVQTVLYTNTPKYRWKFVNRPIFKRSNISRISVDRYIGRSLLQSINELLICTW